MTKRTILVLAYLVRNILWGGGAGAQHRNPVWSGVSARQIVRSGATR